MTDELTLMLLILALPDICTSYYVGMQQALNLLCLVGYIISTIARMFTQNRLPH